MLEGCFLIIVGCLFHFSLIWVHLWGITSVAGAIWLSRHELLSSGELNVVLTLIGIFYLVTCLLFFCSKRYLLQVETRVDYYEKRAWEKPFLPGRSPKERAQFHSLRVASRIPIGPWSFWAWSFKNPLIVTFSVCWWLGWLSLCCFMVTRYTDYAFSPDVSHVVMLYGLSFTHFFCAVVVCIFSSHQFLEIERQLPPAELKRLMQPTWWRNCLEAISSNFQNRDRRAAQRRKRKLGKAFIWFVLVVSVLTWAFLCAWHFWPEEIRTFLDSSYVPISSYLFNLTLNEIVLSGVLLTTLTFLFFSKRRASTLISKLKDDVSKASFLKEDAFKELNGIKEKASKERGTLVNERNNLQRELQSLNNYATGLNHQITSLTADVARLEQVRVELEDKLACLDIRGVIDSLYDYLDHKKVLLADLVDHMAPFIVSVDSAVDEGVGVLDKINKLRSQVDASLATFGHGPGFKPLTVKIPEDPTSLFGPDATDDIDALRNLRKFYTQVLHPDHVSKTNAQWAIDVFQKLFAHINSAIDERINYLSNKGAA